MIRIAKIIENDIVDGEGVCVSLWLQGCPIKCPGCHNPETWNPDGGEVWDDNDLINHIIKLISANGVQRNLSILGGEPLATCEKREFIYLLLEAVRKQYSDIKIFLWTGYTLETLRRNTRFIGVIKKIIFSLDYLIEGPFILKERDITLKWRGSRNQKIWEIKEENIRLVE